nr:immunoglobulin light chain junction region [Macaca mulatta]MOW03204.1 immunoglobulin light chain junction region [Macaca mulatta]MOW03230.1 immunoglobulin light chain junction region [Macaca mulatta]MOW03355.1 immunoglobulin light chain junction region [Macaca mulatta]
DYFCQVWDSSTF